MSELVVAADRIEVVVGDDGTLDIRNVRTGHSVSRGSVQNMLVRMPGDISEPAFLARRTVRKAKDGSVHVKFRDAGSSCRAELHIAASPDGIRFAARVTAPAPIWLVEWQLSGLLLDEVIVPALGGQSLSSAMPAGTTISYKYPFWWNAQFVVGAQDRGGIWLRSMDPGPALKMLRVKRESAGFALTYGFEAEGPLKSKTLEAVWYLDCFENDWTEPAEIHRRWMQEAFNVRTLMENPHAPVWLKDINFVLEIWGMRKDQPVPHHTFDQMITRLKQWSGMYDPRHTLVYVPGFAEHGIDSHAPDYRPSPQLGGARKFKEFMNVAHGLGFRVMVHTNVLAMTFTHRLYPRFKKHQVVDVFGRTQGWGLDMDGDWLFEPYFAYINPGAKAWSDLMTDVIGECVRKYGVDAVFLDQTLLAFNTSKGPNFVSGMRHHIQRLQRAFPSTLFGGEGMHEQVVSALPLAQIHGIDSIAEVHALENGARWRNVHPISTHLFKPFTRFVAHLLTRHPTHPMFPMQEESYAALGVLPALCLYDADQALDMPEVHAMIHRAESII